MSRITLLTDFGTADGYVAAMKGVIAGRAPAAVIEDATHAIPAGDVAAGAWSLARYWRLYPRGTVHLAVVDPGVGGERRALAARAEGRLFVAPDNGILTHVLAAATSSEAVEIADPRYRREPVSATFHGRDVFAPAAAHLAAGLPLHELGPPAAGPVLLDSPAPVRSPTAVLGAVIHVDRFGNLISNVPSSWIAPGARVRVGGRDVGALRRTYAEVESGGLVALIGSAGLLEVAVRDGSAARRLGAERGAEVRIEMPVSPGSASR